MKKSDVKYQIFENFDILNAILHILHVNEDIWYRV